MRVATERLEVVRRHPRHVVLFAAVAGLLLGPLAPAAVLAAAGLGAALAGRVPLALAAAVAVLAGAAFAQARVAALGDGRLPALAGRQVEARAILLEPVRTWRSGTAVARVRLIDVGLVGRQPSGEALPARDLAGEVAVARAEDGRAPPGARVGSELRVRGTVAPLADFEGYQRRRGARAAVEVASWTATGGARGGPAGLLDSARERAARALGVRLQAPEAALLRGMVLGQDEAIAEAAKTDFQRSGLAHLLAVSGQNVLLLCTLVLALGAVAGLPLRTRLAATIVLVALYVPLAGGGPSIQRAGVMGIAGLVAALAGRPASRWYALGVAAALTLGLNPLAVGEPGWQLSFAAVVGLLALAPRIREALARRRVPAPVAEVAAITIAATLATAPLMALHFEQVSLASLPANLAAAAVVAPVMWLGMIAIALAQFSPGLAAPLNLLCAPLLGYLQWVAHAAATAPLAAVPVRLGGPIGLAAAYVSLAAVVVATIKGGRRLASLLDADARSGDSPAHRLLGARRVARGDPLATGALGTRPSRARGRVALAACCAASAVGVLGVVAPSKDVPRLAPGRLVVSFLDVGQGDATLLQRGSSSVLVDTGPPGGPILRRLKEAGVGRLDLLVLTHAEADHEGMALPVIATHRPRLVLDGGAGWPTAVQRGLPAALERAGSRAVAAHAGQVLRIAGLRMRVLWPPPRPPGWRPDGNPNDHALVAHVQDGAFDLLLPADAESNVTAALELPHIEALKVAHHGSADEGLPAMLERTAPDIAAIEVGEDNTYGHPAPSTLAALSTVPELARTDRDGTVRLHVDDGRMRLERGA
ncbi:MAG TPA: ComEC/Rec2 family competence protein [Solirubrobacteraceae bacterium]|nr:ComEC/Rec2 family competence protein [Solirubrobacteraceae bacterium]